MNKVIAEPSSNLSIIDNGSFENGTNKSFFGNKYYIPNGWKGHSDTVLHADTSLFYDGQKSLKVDSIGDNFYVKTTENITVKGNSHYTIGYMVYVKNKQGASFGLTVDSFDIGGNLIESFSVSEVEIERENEWQEISVLVGTQQRVASISISIEIGFSGEEGCNIDAVFIKETKNIFIKEGASVRIAKDNPGIRFKGTVDYISYNKFNNVYENVNVGIVIIPKIYYQTLKEFTILEIQSSGLIFLDIVVDVWNNELTAESDGYYGFNCAMVNIKKDNIVQQFCARAYIRYYENGVEKYIYSDFDLEKNTRSIQEVALKELEQNGENLIAEDLKVMEYFANGGN